jgi:hypothetical protein
VCVCACARGQDAKTVANAQVGALALTFVLCKLLTPVKKLLQLPDKLIKPAGRLEAAPWLRPLIVCGAAVLSLALVGLAARALFARVRAMPSVGPLCVFGGLALLQAVLAMNLAEDALKASLAWGGGGVGGMGGGGAAAAAAAMMASYVPLFYHAHRAVYAAVSLMCQYEDVRTGKVQPEKKTAKLGLQLSLLYWPWHALMLGTGGVSTVVHVVDVVALLCQHKLMETLNQLEILSKLASQLVGTSAIIQALESLLMQAGRAITNPAMVLQWLEQLTPSPVGCCLIVTLRQVRRGPIGGGRCTVCTIACRQPTAPAARPHPPCHHHPARSPTSCPDGAGGVRTRVRARSLCAHSWRRSSARSTEGFRCWCWTAARTPIRPSWGALWGSCWPSPPRSPSACTSRCWPRGRSSRVAAGCSCVPCHHALDVDELL